jgi:predicted ATPase
VTFLFTDIEGSTRRWESDAAAMGSALVVHDEVLRTAIESHGGFLFSHSGDGVVAAFASPKAAVDAAVAAQQRLELPVRMGLATGEAELRDDDYFGTVLNRAARVMAAGHGGQILLADTTAGLLSGADLLNLGPRRLRDLPIPITVFQLRAPGLGTDFPPLRTLEVNPGNLRPAATSLVGRESEIAEIEAELRNHRLVTLTGVGGVGKTRLATEVAKRLVDEFPDGVWVFELATVANPAAVPDAVAAVLGITQQPGKTVSESVAATLEGRVRLLVFDNCEHVLDAAADLVEAILAQSATVTILATSREGLGVAHEQIWPVKSLKDSAAVELLVERAHSVAPGFSADDAVLEICHRLDRIPLAIELAASRMASMTATEVRDRLDHRFKLLVGSRRGQERHQTLRHAVQWSYDLLHDAERTLLDRCSIFAGGFDVESACAVAGSDDADDYVTLDLLDALVRKSLLVADRSSGRTRYSMLETIREFAKDQLVARGEATVARAAHARYFAGREADIMSLWDSPSQREAYNWFAIELPNLRTAFRWAANQGDLDVAAPIATFAAWFGFLTENFESIVWAEELIEPARAVDHPRLTALYALTSLCYNTGQISPAIRYTEAAERAISGESDHLAHPAEGFLGSAYPAVGRPERWVQWCRAQLARGRYTDPYSRTSIVIGLTVAGSIDDAMAAAGGLIDAAEATGNPYVLSWALVAHGYAFRASDPGLALAAARRGLAIARDSGNRFNETMLVHMLSGLEAEHGDRMAALDYFTVSIGNFHESGNTYMVSAPLALLAVLLDRLGRYESAATIAGFAAANPMTTAALPEIDSAIVHLCDVLGRATYESFACAGAGMTNTAMVAYAYDQIDQARTELKATPT